MNTIQLSIVLLATILLNYNFVNCFYITSTTKANMLSSSTTILQVSNYDSDNNNYIPSHHTKSGKQPTGMMTQQQQQQESTVSTPFNRRSVLNKFIATTAAATALIVVSSQSANAFENKISNQYDDRPRQRGSQPKDLGVSKRKTLDGYDEYIGLKDCPSKPDCFCSTISREDDPDHSIPEWIWPAKITSVETAFADIQQVITSYEPGQNNIDGGGFLIKKYDPTNGYIYVQFESLKNGYIDDFEIAYVPVSSTTNNNRNVKKINTVQIRSSSRLGYLDYGVNAKRINYIASKLRANGWTAEGVDYSKHREYAVLNGVE